MNTRYTGQEISKILQTEAERVMSRKCDFHDIYTERGLYDCISTCEGSEFPEDWQLEIYPSIVRYEDSKSLTFVHKKFGSGRRRSIYDTIVAAIYRKAHYIRAVAVVHRDNPNIVFKDCVCIGCQDARAVPQNAVEAVVPNPMPPPNA